MAEKVADKGFEFSSRGIGTVLKLHRLKVPPYQREYAWDTEEVEQLYADFSNAKQTNKDYFLGTIVTISRGGNQPLEIVDGQQRLTTTALFIAAIRDHLKSLGSAQMIVQSVDQEFLRTIDRGAGQWVPRLVLNIDDNEFFVRLIEGETKDTKLVTTRQSHELLLRASKTARQWVKKIAATLSESDVPARLNDWLDFIEHHATVVLLEAPNGAQAFKMFETLNDRGLRTSQADLVKSYLFGQSEDRITEAQSRWSSMRDNLDEIDEEDRAINFLRHTLIATKRFSRADEVYDITQKEVRGTGNALAFLTDLERLSRAYVATYRADAEMWAGYSRPALNALRTFNQFDLKPMRPLLMAVALRFSQGEFSKAIKLLVSISVRLVVASSTRSGTNEQTFAAAALAVYKKELSTTKALKGALARVIVADSDFVQTFAMARSSKQELARYYLRALEAAAANEPEPWYVPNDDQAAVTLEHVFPRNPKPDTWKTFSQEDAGRYLKRLGNLCLLQRSTNSNTSNDDFKSKKPLYRDSPYTMTNMIATYSDWSPGSIEKRQAQMAEIAVKAWPV